MSIKERMSLLHSSLLCDCETKRLKIENILQLPLISHRRCRSTIEVRLKVLVSDGKPINEVVNVRRMNCPGHVLRMSRRHLS